MTVLFIVRYSTFERAWIVYRDGVAQPGFYPRKPDAVAQARALAKTEPNSEVRVEHKVKQ